MKKNIFGLFGVFACLILIFACSKPETVINGEAFVVTKGAGNYKLGLLEISVIPEKAMLSHLQLKNNDAAIAVAKKEFDAAKLASDLSSQSLGKTLQKVDQKGQEYDATSAAFSEGDPTMDKLSSLTNRFNDYNWSVNEMNSVKKKADDDRAALEKATSKLNNLSSRSSYFEGLPPALLTVTSNSDGKFSFKLPPGPGRYAVVAHATRKISDIDEVYYWAVWIDADGTEQTLFLSNNNLTTSQSATSAISAAIYE